MYVYVLFKYLFVEVAKKDGYMDEYINTSHSTSSVNTGNMSVIIAYSEYWNFFVIS